MAKESFDLVIRQLRARKISTNIVVSIFDSDEVAMKVRQLTRCFLENRGTDRWVGQALDIHQVFYLRLVLWKSSLLSGVERET